MNKTILVTGSFFGLTAIVLGAFAAHGLEKLIDGEAIQTFETGVKYQMYHALFLLILGIEPKLASSHKKWIYYSITAGVLLFSGSIYLLATNSLNDFDFRVIGFITPLGGLLFILGWIIFGYRVFKRLG